MRFCAVCGREVTAESQVCPACQSELPADSAEPEMAREGIGEPAARVLSGAGLEWWEEALADAGRRRQARLALLALALVVLLGVQVLAWQSFVHGAWGMRLSTFHEILFAGSEQNPLGGFFDSGLPTAPAQLYMMHPDGSGLRRLTDPASGGYFSPAWSPDGGHLAAFQFSATGQSARLVIMRADGSQAQVVPSVSLAVNNFLVGNGVVVAQLAKLLAWSPDGRQLLAPTGQDSYLVVNADGTHPRQIDGDRPTWAPDGRHVAFYGPNAGEPPVNAAFAPLQLTGGSLEVLDTLTLQRRELPAIANLSDGALAWSPDGRYLAATTWRVDVAQNQPVGGVLVVRPDGSDQHQVIQWAGGEVDQLSWSPDGSKLAAVVVKSVSLEDFASGDAGPLVSDLWVVNSDSSSPRALGACATDAPVWSPDGRQVLVVRYSDDLGLSQLFLEEVGEGGVGEQNLSASVGALSRGQVRFLFAPSWSPI